MKRNACIWSTLFLTFLWLSAAYATGRRVSALNRPQVVAAYGHLPLSFEANRGQTDERVSFLARGRGYSLFLTGSEAVLALQKPDGKIVLRMKPEGANPGATVSAIDELPGRSNYFIGNDPKQWRVSVPTYAAVKYAGVYPGIDLVYHGSQGQLDYDFRLAPGADPGAIELGFQGARKLSVNRAGDLIIKLGSGEVIEHAPVVFQEVGGQRQLLAGHYVLRGRGRVGFSLAAYDRNKTLAIDPTLAYSTYLGGSGVEDCFGIAVDSSGNVYVSGLTESTDFPTTAGAFQTTVGSGGDAFVSKLNAAASALVYSTYMGGTGLDQGSGIAVDSSGNVYVSGFTESFNFPTTLGAFQTTYGGQRDAFVSKLNAAGSALLYSTYLGGSGGESGGRLVLDASGDAYVTGTTFSPDFPTTPGAFQTTFGGSGGFGDAFVSKLNAAGSGLVYSTYLGGSAEDEGVGVAVDSSGNAYVTGATFSSDFPTTPGAFQTTLSGIEDAFVSKLNAAGSGLVYSTHLAETEFGLGIAIDASGNAYITGATVSPNFPTTSGAFQTTYGGSEDAFVSKLNAVGSALIYSTYLGGSGDEQGFGGIALDASGNAYVTGFTSSTDFPTTSGAFQTTFGGSPFDAFVSKLNATGSALVSSTYLGGSNDDRANGIAVDASGNTYVTGFTASSNFPTTPGAFQTTLAGGPPSEPSDAFISKFSFGIPLSCFSGRLEIRRDKDAFDLRATFNLAPGDSINPLTEPVTLTIGTYSVTIPADSFVKHDDGYYFEGVINGVRVRVLIKHRHCENNSDVEMGNKGGSAKCACNADTYTLQATGSGANLKGTTNPVTVMISIGDNTGTTQIRAE